MQKKIYKILRENLLFIFGAFVTSLIIAFLFRIYFVTTLDSRALLEFTSEREITSLGRSFALSVVDDLQEPDKVQLKLERLKEELLEIKKIDLIIPEEDKFRVIASSEKQAIGSLNINENLKGVFSSGNEKVEWLAIDTKLKVAGPVSEKQRLVEITLPVKTHLEETVAILFLRLSQKAQEDQILTANLYNLRLILVSSSFIFIFLVSFAYLANQNQKLVLTLNEKLRLKDELLSMTAHELGTPLAHIKGSLDVVINEAGGKIGDYSFKILKRSFESTERLIAMVEDILTVSRFERGKIEIFPRPIHLETTVSVVVKEYRAPAEDKRLSLIYEPPIDDLPKVIADPDKIKEILGNFLSNAIKYTDTGDIKVSISEVKGSVVVSVTDTGAGISQQDLPKLFERFSRIKRTAGHKRGSGLGLYISKLLVKAHHGKIWAESVLGKGSVFTFSLPIPH